MRWFLLSLGFLIISWIFFVASFGFAAPAQAETWSCSYLDAAKREPKPFVLVRNGKNFDLQGHNLTFKIETEDSKIILIGKIVDAGKPPSKHSDGFIPLVRSIASYSGGLHKKAKRFTMVHLIDDLGPEVRRTWAGNCVVY